LEKTARQNFTCVKGIPIFRNSRRRKTVVLCGLDDDGAGSVIERIMGIVLTGLSVQFVSDGLVKLHVVAGS
jgi:hypothetical protein